MAEFSKRDRAPSQVKAKPASTMKTKGASPGIKSIKLKGGPKTAVKTSSPKASKLQKIKVSRPKAKGKG